MRSLILVAAAALALSLAPDVARADYVCNVFLGPSSPNLGDYGHVSIRFNTLPDCGGNTIGYFYLCSIGADDAICPLSTQYHWDQQGLFTLYNSLRSAVTNNDRVTRYLVPCGHNGGTTCIGTLTFYAN